MMENTRRNALSERELVADLLKHVDGESLLDVGAGYGTEALLAAKAGAASVCAIDADEERAAYVEKNASLNNIEIDVKAALVGDGDGTFCIDDLGFSPTIAKMDIEGAEWSALNGMGDTLESIDRFYLEVHPTTIPEEASVAGIKSLLVDAGFDVSMRPCRSEQLHLTAVRHVSRCPTP